MKTRYPEKEYLGISGLPEFVKSSVELAYGKGPLGERVNGLLINRSPLSNHCRVLEH